MTLDNLAKLPETLAALEQRIEALEKENAGLKEAGRQEGAPGELSSLKACEDIRNILRRLRSQKKNHDDVQEYDITDIVFLKSNGVIKHIGSHGN